jgi:type I restriction-modification system DNA methylase subunit
LGLSDEETLIRPKLFPKFLSGVLDFSELDYTPEKRTKDQNKPDFTPNDLIRHPFIFETKGNDSTRKNLIEEYKTKSKGYLESIPAAEYAVITNLTDLVVFSKLEDRLLDEYSFSFRTLYAVFKRESIGTGDKNVENFLRFVQKFRKKPLSLEQKVKAIADARPHEVKETQIPYEFKTLTDSIRRIIEWLREDVSSNRGSHAILETLEHSTERKRAIAMEIYVIRSEITLSYEIPEEIEEGDLDVLLRSKDKLIRQAVDLYFYRVAYFTMVRILLVRAWEDSGFIRQELQTLFDGGFGKWYFDTYNKHIVDVLKEAFKIAKDKYEWLYTDETNYSWYLPTDQVLVDVLYEFAKYNLSVLNRDVLGVVYEDYLDIQDKKNKGQYYTPFPIVNLIWNRVGYSSNQDFYRNDSGKRTPKKVLDPATGSGSFLVEAARRIRTQSRPLRTLESLLDIKNAIIAGLYGSEISVFSYYITEVNLLIQLTPVIKDIIELEPSRQDIEGRFALSVVRQDSLSLHSPPDPIDEGAKPEADEHTEYGLELLKPIGEKLRVYESIKNSKDFDYSVANPPYIGEDGHKELFRRSLKQFPYWSRYFQGKMDYLYFFVMLALQKLRVGGRLGFITTSYWLTADGASKLRKYVLDRARIVEIINFGEVKLFEHAKGQHSMVFILEREDSQAKRTSNKIKLVEVSKQPEAPTVDEQLRRLCVHIEKYVSSTRHADEYMEVYYSAVVQGELTEDPWYLFHKKDVESLLKKIEKAGVPLEAICDVSQGVVPGCLSVDKSVMEALPQRVIDDNNIELGMGVLVLSAEEVRLLGLNKEERSLIRPFYKNSDIHRYFVDREEEKYLIYTTKDTKINKFPNILSHLEIFKPRLEMKRETQEGRLPWWSLHWPREEYIFEGKKIVCPYRSLLNTFAYSDDPLYGSTDMYFITKKRNEKLDGNDLDLLYVLGVLNSVVIRLWTLYRTKPKGNIRELFYKPLLSFPIRTIDTSKPREVAIYERIIKRTKRMIQLKEALSKYDRIISATNRLEEGRLPPTDNLDFLEYLDPKDITTVGKSQSISYPRMSKEFKLKRALRIESTALKKSRFEYQLAVESAKGEVMVVEGEIGALKLLRQIIVRSSGCTWSDFEKEKLPVTVEKLSQGAKTARNEIEEAWAEAKSIQSDIDREVCELYGLSKDEVSEAATSTTLAS